MPARSEELRRRAVAGCLVLTLAAGCSRANNLLLGRVQADVGSHLVVVTDCYRFHVPAPVVEAGAGGGRAAYRFTPCRDADVQIREGELSVNARRFGPLRPHDAVLVDHGVVSIHHAPKGLGDSQESP